MTDHRPENNIERNNTRDLAGDFRLTSQRRSERGNIFAALFGAALTAFAVPSVAFAQDAPAASGQGADEGLTDIIVTAEHRSENLQKVPVSVGVISGDDQRTVQAGGDDTLLATRQGKAIRFQSEDVREFQSRNSTGVRGITLREGDAVISLSILHRAGVKDQDERDDYLRFAPWKGEREGECTLAPERFERMQEREQFILTVCANGYGKRSSAYEYRVTGRGGSGIINIETTAKNGDVAATFPVEHGDQIMLVTDKGQLIRCPVEDIRIAGRSTQGVIVFDTADDEHVVSVEHIGEEGDNGENGNGS